MSSLQAAGESAVARLASLIGVTDFASTYLALGEGIDPTPVAAIAALKRRTTVSARTSEPPAPMDARSSW